MFNSSILTAASFKKQDCVFSISGLLSKTCDLQRNEFPCLKEILKKQNYSDNGIDI